MSGADYSMAAAHSAGPGFVIWGKAAMAKDVVASAKDVTISFNLLSGRKACQDLVLTHKYISARGVRDHLRKYSEHDAVRILDWHSKLLIRGAPLDLDCTTIFAHIRRSL